MPQQQANNRESEIVRIEHSLGETLPHDYRTFLLDFFIETPQKEYFFYQDIYNKEEPFFKKEGRFDISSISWFLNIKEINEFLLCSREDFIENVNSPILTRELVELENLVQIAQTGGTAAVFLAFKGRFKNKIYYFDHIGFAEISTNFKEFLDNCVNYPDVDFYDPVAKQDLTKFKENLNDDKNCIFLQKDGITIHKIIKRLLRPKQSEGLIENYKEFLSVLIEREIIEIDALKIWLATFDLKRKRLNLE